MKETLMLLVKADALPDTYIKVVAAKRMLMSGEAKNASQAAKICGISRSAFYKYKDSVFEYNHVSGKMFTLHAILVDKAGALSDFLGVLNKYGANIITVNQGIPVSGVAEVSVTARASGEEFELDDVLHVLSKELNVVSVRQILSE